ncbi:hypothetical protein FN846DRAFT_981882 [Sphaerosporella brunnea]|uniref:DUF7079 domain-containing protein n=1 Tax=Sphaerosporella brunnea TaxID=1250544 RepID=A0A5J5ECF5_9PEZI|nr:hypothetical protein FN846DRAFT_981882 [Sphaerosporella brunnea]
MQQANPTHSIPERPIGEHGGSATTQADSNVVPADIPPHDGVLLHPAVDPHCPTISAAEQQACIELSLLFLDTEVREHDIYCVARELHILNLDDTTLRNLLRHDLFPVLWGNITDPAGEWAYFEEEWLLGEIKSRRGSWLRRAVTAPAHAVAWALLANAVVPPFQDVMLELARRRQQVAA